MLPLSHRIAKGFAARLLAELGPDTIAEINRRNGTPTYSGGACATHDFCDANMPMAEAFEAETGHAPEPWSDDDDAALWNTAWTIARAAGFDPAAVRA